jgi:hypothetical protein
MIFGRDNGCDQLFLRDEVSVCSKWNLNFARHSALLKLGTLQQ